MGDLPHVKLGDKVTAEVHDIVETYLREHGDIVVGKRLTVQLCNRAIDWWNARQQEAEAEELTEAVAQAWHYPDTGEDDS